jgi:phenylacetate-coenzyme A ligase PaaK-like adenylate-forming protein
MPYNLSLINTESILKANAESFETIALQVFNYQFLNNALYRDFCNALRIDPLSVEQVTQIPFLPVSFFKTHAVLTGQSPESTPAAELVFESSGTTGETPSRHYVQDASIYERSLLQGFEQFYGDPAQYAILALLPSYLERKNASLVHMATTLMKKSGHPDNGFYINEWERLQQVLARLEANKQKVLLLGVTFALLDFADAYPMHLAHTIVMETGGMKGRRAELTRHEVHAVLKEQWQLKQVHSEYGMTELLSQAYAAADGLFSCTDTMRVLVRDINDPLDVKTTGSGVLNIIDLANINSCSFIATEDIGTIAADGTFEVLGRMDHSALRGCSLMVV